MVEWAQSMLDSINAMPLWQVALFFFVCGSLQCTIPIFPGDFVLIIGAGIWTGGFLNDFLPVLLPYWAGSTLFSLLMTEAGRRFGERLLSKRWLQRIFPEKAQKRCRSWLKKRGAIPIFAAKFIFGMNVPMLLFAGLMRLKRKSVYPAVILTTAVHNTLFYTLGSALGLNWDTVKVFVMENSAIVAIALALVIAVVFWVRSKTTGDKAEESE